MSYVATIRPFPFCISDASSLGISVGDNTRYPIGLSFPDFFRMYWGPKKYNWREVFADGSSGGSESTVGGADNYITDDAQTEVEKVCPGKGWSTTVQNSEEATDASYQFQVFTDPTGFPPAVKSGGLYYPRIKLFLQGIAGQVTKSASSEADDSVGLFMSVSWPFGGGRVNIYYITNDDNTDDDQVVIQASDILVDQWWGYDPADGAGNMYNTSDGSRIRQNGYRSASGSWVAIDG